MSNLYRYCVGAIVCKHMHKLNPCGWHLWMWPRVARLVAIMADKDKENILVGQQPKCVKLFLSLPKDRFSFSVDDKDLEEAMKTYSVKKYMALKNSWTLKNFEDWFKAKRSKTEVPCIRSASD